MFSLIAGYGIAVGMIILGFLYQYGLRQQAKQKQDAANRESPEQHS